MKRRKTLPTRAGWYWYTEEFGRAEWRPVKVYRMDGGLAVDYSPGYWKFIGGFKSSQFGTRIKK